jgi:short-subunit dehydrogenase
MIANLEVPWISAKIPPETVAQAIVQAVRRERAEVIVPFQARLLYWAQCFAPRLADWAVRTFRLQGWE